VAERADRTGARAGTGHRAQPREPLPGLFTDDELGRRFQLPDAPVSPAPAAAGPSGAFAPAEPDTVTHQIVRRPGSRPRPFGARNLSRGPAVDPGAPTEPLPAVVEPPVADPGGVTTDRTGRIDFAASFDLAARTDRIDLGTGLDRRPGARTGAPTSPDRPARIDRSDPADGGRDATSDLTRTWPDIDPATPRRPPAGRRGAGRHAARGRIRTAWEASYMRFLLIADLIAALLAGAAAFSVRFGGAVTHYNQQYLLFTVLLPLILIMSLVLSRAYERRFLFVGTDEYQRVMRAGIAMTATIAIISYAFEVGLARGYVVLAVPLATLLALAFRFVLRKQLHHRRARGRCLRRVIVVGHELAVIGMARQLSRELYHGLEVVGCCLPPRHDGDVGLPVYGTFDEVAVAVQAARADTVIVLSCPELDGQTLRRLAWRLEREDIDLIVASSLVDVAGARTTIRPVDGLPMLHVEHPRLSGAARVVKSMLDRVGAVVGLLLLSPLMVAIAIAIRHDSPGPVFFRQIRVGKGGREFVIFKFRTMGTDAERRLTALRAYNEHDGVLFKMRDDPRVTRVGRILRRFSLDELPQLINVLLGEMSLVGPRPPLPEEVMAYPSDMRRRLAVSPGMTGLWQVSGRSDLSWEETVRLDLRYVENWSFSLDLVILLRTLSAVWRSSGAY
jgi:exopolysaccharide biosynthesis polyprenyl glycosylphosphotransferase